MVFYNKKQILRKLSILGAFVFQLLYLTAFPCIIYAGETQTVKLEETTDVIFVFQYEGETPSVVLTSPEGTIYDSDDDYARCEKNEDISYYYISGAKSGDWKVECDKKNNERVDLDVLRWYREISVESFFTDSIEEENVKVHTKVISDLDEHYDWYIYAVTKDSAGKINGQKELKKSGARTNRDEETSVSLESLPDGKYYLMMEAVVTYSDGTEMSESAEISDLFEITGHTEGLEKSVVTILDQTKGQLSIDWSECEEIQSPCIVAVFQDDMNEPDFYQEVEDEPYCDVLLDSESKTDPKIVLTHRKNNTQKQYERIIPLDSGVSINVETEEQTAERMMTVTYDTGDIEEIFVQIFINDEEQTYHLQGQGVFGVLLNDMEVNEVDIQYQVNDVYYLTSKRIIVNTLPPSLTLYGTDQVIRTADKTVTISGLLKNGVKLLVNGDEQVLNEDGTFSVTVTIDSDEQTITFAGVAENGVQAVRTVKAQRVKEGADLATRGLKTETGSIDKKKILFIEIVSVAAVGLILIAAGLVLGRKYKGIDWFFRIVIFFLSLSGILGAGLCIYCAYRYTAVSKSISGDELMNILTKATENELWDRLDEAELWSGAAKQGGIFAGICFMAVIVLTGIRVIVGKATGILEEKKNAMARVNKRKRKSYRNKEIVCPRCGSANKGNARYCSKCGHEFSDEDIDG